MYSENRFTSRFRKICRYLISNWLFNQICIENRRQSIEIFPLTYFPKMADLSKISCSPSAMLVGRVEMLALSRQRGNVYSISGARTNSHSKCRGFGDLATMRRGDVTRHDCIPPKPSPNHSLNSNHPNNANASRATRLRPRNSYLQGKRNKLISHLLYVSIQLVSTLVS